MIQEIIIQCQRVAQPIFKSGCPYVAVECYGCKTTKDCKTAKDIRVEVLRHQSDKCVVRALCAGCYKTPCGCTH